MSHSKALAIHSWGKGTPVALGAGKKRRRENDEDSDEDSGYFPSPTGGARKKRVLVDEDGVVGVIERVHIDNFMCHSQFTWEPNQRVNFVTGANGSGKSSMLQAITLGLLGDPKSVKRYTKVAEFIKKGASKATIQVTLKNCGDDAYKPETYGRSITFQRTINESGTSAYLVKDEEMKDVVRKSKDAKEECLRILEKFQIQVDSPIVILQQDEAKEMLKVESADKLYKFFEKATLIRQCFDQYSAAQVEYNKAYDTLKMKARALKDLNAEYRRAMIKYEEIQRTEAMDKELVQTKGEYAWARVHAARENIEQMDTDMGKVKTKMSGPKDKLMGLHEKLSELKLRKNDLEEQLQAEEEKWAVQEQEVLAKKEHLDSLKQKLKEMQAVIKKEGQLKNTITQEMRMLEEQVEELERRDKGEVERQEQQRRLHLKKLESDKKAMEEEIKLEGVSREEADNKIKESQEMEQGIRKEVKSKKERHSAIKKEMEEMEGASEQRLAVFGPKMPLLDRAIQKSFQQNRFQRLPIGPVGQYVKLRGDAAKEPEVARVVETELSRGQLTAYLCHCDADRRELVKILDEVFGQAGRNSKPRIFTSKFLDRRHNVPKPHSLPPKTACLMDYLQIDDNQVFNHLVDQKSIESVLVCRTQAVAKSLMTHKENVPQNVSYAITLDYYKFNPPRGASSYRSYYMDPIQGSGMLRSTLASQVAERGEEVKGLERHLMGLENEKEALLRARSGFEGEKKRAVAKIQQLRTKMTSISSQLTQVKAEQENFEDDLTTLRNKLEGKKTEVEEADARVQEAQLRRAGVNQEIREREEEYKREKVELSDLKSGTNPLSKMEREINNNISTRTKEILNQEKLVKKLNTELENLKEEQKKQRDDASQFEAAARKITGREVVPDRTVKQLNAKILQLQKKIKSKQGENQDYAEFLNNFQDLKERYQDMRSQIEQLENLLQKIEKMNDERLDNFHIIRQIISNNVRRRFNAMIANFAEQIGCRVYLRIDNTKKEVTFCFQNLDGSEERDSSDVSRLSGGEKSFTQMCLICALWDMMEPPFRCLDEWDVFLDAVNRKAISKELLNFSLKNQSKQFIFISPQGACDLSNVDHGVVQVTEIKKS